MDVRDPFTLDRELGRVARAWVAWRRQLERGEGLDRDPFEGARELLSRETFGALRELPESDPLRRPLLRWVYRLMEQRIDRGVLLAIASARTVDEHVIETPEHNRLTLAVMLRRALADPARRAAWLASFVERSEAHSSAVALLWERRQEIARRLGLDDFDALEPHVPVVVSSAKRWLDQTDDLASEWRTQSLADLVRSALAPEADRGWPARLALRSLADFFRETRLLDGLPLDPGRLPEPLAPASFLRGLVRLGVAFSDAAAPADLPFAIGRDPRSLRRRTLGAIFASVPLGQAFPRRALGLGSAAACEQTRALWRSALLESRAQALRLLLRAAALSGRAALSAAFEEQTERVFGVVVSPAAAGSLWRLHVDDLERFAALMLAATRVEQLIEQHDEDWYRNPRAAEQLRAETSMAPETTVDERELAAGSVSLFRRMSRELA